MQTDLDGDGRLDLLLHFWREALLRSRDLASGRTALSLPAEHADCRHAVGTPPVRVIP